MRVLRKTGAASITGNARRCDRRRRVVHMLFKAAVTGIDSALSFYRKDQWNDVEAS